MKAKTFKILLMMEIRNNRKLIFGWAIGIFSILFMYMILFPSVKEMGQMKLDAMPKEMLQLMGMESMDDFRTFPSYFGTIYNIVLIAISIFSGILCGGLLYKEEKTKSIEFLYSMEVSRAEIYLAKVMTGFLGILLVVGCGTISTMICGFWNGGSTFDAELVLRIIKISSCSAFFFGAVGFFVGGITGRISAGSISAMLVLATYLVGYLGNLLGTKAEWLKAFSPLEVLKPQNAMHPDSDLVIGLMTYMGFMILLVVCGLGSYRKRDLFI
ncbi:MAG: ABC transporter permease subunit [Lachnospiraceae bacterium]|nr:ABC transporter permease subunit [Lachnospiraceae bacterium]